MVNLIITCNKHCHSFEPFPFLWPCMYGKGSVPVCLNSLSVYICTGDWTLNNTSVCSDDRYILYVYLCTSHRTFYLSVPEKVTEQFSCLQGDWTIYLSVQKAEQFICQFRWLNNIFVCTGDWTLHNISVCCGVWTMFLFLSDHDWTIFLSDQVTEHEVQNSVRSIPKLDTLILVKVKLLL